MKNIDELLKNSKKIHFIGIGGSGMCPIAEILLKRGYTVTGSDNNDTETFRRIEKDGAKVFLGQVKENIAPDTDLVIYTNAIYKTNEELIYAQANFPCVERAEVLGALSRLFTNCIGICGTHGKTTTTSMTTLALLDAGLDPSAVIGGKLPAIDAYGKVGDSENFVCEACEYNNTFLHINAEIAVLLNVDADHLDFFGDLDGVKNAFEKFCNLATKTIVYNGDDENTLDVIRRISGKKLISVGRNESNEWQAKNIDVTNTSHSFYDVYHNGDFVTKVELSVPGEHNIINSLCAFVAAYESGADIQGICLGLKRFGGASRRFDNLGTFKGVTFVDDYAHHPTEIEATLKTAKMMNYKNVWAVHQPFTFDRTTEFIDEFAKALSIADKCVISKIMPGRDVQKPDSVSAADLAAKIDGAVQLDTFEEICDYVCANAEEGDLVITLGCGDVYKVARMMCNKLKNE